MQDLFLSLVTEYHNVISEAERVTQTEYKMSLYQKAKRLQKQINDLVSPSELNESIQKDQLVKWIESWE